VAEQDPYTEYRNPIDAAEQIRAGTLPYRPTPFVDDELWGLCCKIWRKLPGKRPPMDTVFNELIRMEKYVDFLL
jgi:hypothetical protein